ncbi:MAG: hypothetical protein IJ188_05485 [Clostridia bacterium]|nr:hypothetical protein [Clostridia bacterium]
MRTRSCSSGGRRICTGGRTKPEQITENAKALDAPALTAEELREIDEILG